LFPLREIDGLLAGGGGGGGRRWPTGGDFNANALEEEEEANVPFPRILTKKTKWMDAS